MLQNLDVEYLYEAPLAMEKERLAQVVCECLNIPCPEPQLGDWKQMVDALKNPTSEVTIALVGNISSFMTHTSALWSIKARRHRKPHKGIHQVGGFRVLNSGDPR